MAGLGLRLGLRPRYRPYLVLPSMRMQIEGLRDGTTPNGRTSANPLKVPGQDPLPNGMDASGRIITITADPGLLEDWDFRGYCLTPLATIAGFRQCLLGERTVAGLLAYLDPYPGHEVLLLEHCTVEGPYTYGGANPAIKARVSGTGASVSMGSVREIAHCRFVGLSGDPLKLTGKNGQIVRWNYFGAPVTIPQNATLWAAGASYAVGDYVYFPNDAVFSECLQAHVAAASNRPPDPSIRANKSASNAWWRNRNPHTDLMTTAAVLDSLTFANNLIDFVPDPTGPKGPYLQVGINNIIRVSRNTNDEFPVNRIVIEGNVGYHGPFQSFPIEITNGGKPNFNGPVIVRDNWFPANANGNHYRPSADGMVDEWEGNRDSATDAPIPGPTLRVRVGAPVSSAAPVLSGTAQEGQALAVSTGTWDNSPASFAYRWLRGSTAIGGATGASYVQVAADVGQTVTAEVTATNAQGSATARSNSLGATQPLGDPLPQKMVFGFMGRSNMDFLTVATPFYIDTSIPRPSFAARTGFRANCTYVGMHPSSTHQSTETDLVVRPIDSSTVGSSINMGIVAVAEWLGRASPDRDFLLKAFDKGGTTFEDLVRDTEDLIPGYSAPGATGPRWWSKFEEINDYELAEFGQPRLVQDFWLADGNFQARYAPGMTGQNANGTPFTLGASNPTTGTTVDHFVYDCNTADPEDLGDGLWPRTTGFHEMRREDSLSTDQAQDAFRDEPRNAHWVEPLGAFDMHYWDAGHARKNSIFGQFYGGLQLIPAIARELGFPVHQPQEYRQETTADGLQTRIFVKLPNGGDLTTMRRRANAAGSAFPAPFPATPLPWQHELSSLSVTRPGGSRTRIHRRDLPTDAAGLASYPLTSRATVTIEDPGTGTGAAREGCILIEWEEPIENDALVYVRHKFDPGHGWQPELPFLDFPIETVPAITFDDLMIPYPGLVLRPWMPPVAVSGVAAGGVDAPEGGGDVAAPSASFATGATGPVFRDTSNTFPASTTEVEFDGLLYMPSSVSSFGGRGLMTQEAGGFRLVIARAAVGATQISLAALNDGSGTSLGSVSAAALGLDALTDDQWHRVVLRVAMTPAGAQVAAMLDGGAPVTTALPASASALRYFTNGREFSFLADVGGAGAISNRVPAGVRFGHLRLRRVTGGVETLHGDVTGNAAAVNAHSWKMATSGEAT